VAARETVPHDKGFIVGTGRESTQAAIKASKRRPSTAPTPSCRTPFLQEPDDE